MDSICSLGFGSAGEYYERMLEAFIEARSTHGMKREQVLEEALDINEFMLMARYVNDTVYHDASAMIWKMICEIRE